MKYGFSAYSDGVFSLKKCRHRSLQIRHPESAARHRLAMSGWWVLVEFSWIEPRYSWAHGEQDIDVPEQEIGSGGMIRVTVMIFVDDLLRFSWFKWILQLSG
jgi:hypothetical protein